MVATKRPVPPRVLLASGRVLDGNLHRSPSTRLADHLSTLKGYLSLTGVTCPASGERFSHLVVNLDQVLFVEEMDPLVPAPQ
jgi:hypothetical protein